MLLFSIHDAAALSHAAYDMLFFMPCYCYARCYGLLDVFHTPAMLKMTAPLRAAAFAVTLSATTRARRAMEMIRCEYDILT